MAKQAILKWTFASLVGAFLDLSIAFLLLCGSTITFFASKFLNLFGLSLPCLCNGLFSDPNSCDCYCVQRVFWDSPVAKISNVQMSVKSRFPFDRILVENQEGDDSDVLLRDGGYGSLTELLGKYGSDEFEGKEALNWRTRPGTLRHGQKNGADGNQEIGRDSSPSPAGSGRITGGILEDKEGSAPFSSAGDKALNDGDTSAERMQDSFQWNDLMGGTENFERDESFASGVVCPDQHAVGSDRTDVNIIRELEQALEEEHATRAKLYQELENERSAAATAAEEAMAMILRLQKEKASTEMEARQYQRMIEEKSKYDAEEMNILKEILVRRERENHFLEKEVEAFRGILTPGNEGLVGMSRQRPRISLDSREDSSFMLRQIRDYIGKKETVKNLYVSSDYDSLSIKKHDSRRVLPFGEESPSLSLHEIERMDSWGLNSDNRQLYGPKDIDGCEQEKQLLAMEEDPSDAQDQWTVADADSSFLKLDKSETQESLERTIVVDEEPEKNVVGAEETQRNAVKNDHTHESGIGYPFGDAYPEKHGNDANLDETDQYNSIFEAEPTLHDVHVVDYKSKLCDQRCEKAAESLPMGTKLDFQSETSGLMSVDILSDPPATSSGGTPPGVSRSMSDIKSLSDKSQDKSSFSEMRRNSMSSVNHERLKLESEVGWLRQRLTIVQEGREKLSFSVDHREREQMHLQLLDDIARQLKEIRQLTEPGSIRRVSLPPPYSKASLKKPRSRSAYMGIHGSS